MELKLSKSTQDILLLVSDLTHKPFEFIHKPDLQTMAIVKMARVNMPSHIIYYQTTGSGIIDHLIAHECGHIFRMSSASPEDRKVPASDMECRRYANRQIESDLERLSNIMTYQQFNSNFGIWFEGIIKQVTSMPVDMRIEKWIYEKYPDLRKVQMISLDRQIRDNAQSLSKKVSQYAPKKIYEANNYMNYAFALFMELLIGKKYTAPYRNTPYTGLGSRLADLVIKSEDMGYGQDIEIINQWTDMIGLKGWYYWTDFEDVPSDYLQSI
jgi:hypothetical protein